MKKKTIKTESLKKKIVKRVSERKPTSLEKLSKMPSVPIENKSKRKPQVELDVKQIKGVRVEWFDDRFYKVDVPLNIAPEWLENIPANYIEHCKDHIEVFLPSFTTIYGNTEPMPFLPKWRGKVGNVEADIISEVAKQKGSNIHNAIDLLLKGHAIIFQNPKNQNVSEAEIKAFKKKHKRPVNVLYSQEEMIQVTRFKRLIDVIKPEIVDTEQHLFNFKECYAGTRDQKWIVSKDVTLKLSSKTTKVVPAGTYVVDLKTGKHFDDKYASTQLSAYAEADPESEKITGAIGINLNKERASGVDGYDIMIKTREELAPYFEHFKDLKRIFFFDNPVRPKKFELPLVITYDKKRGKK